MSVELKEKSKKFGLRILKLVDALPNSVSGRAVANVRFFGGLWGRCGPGMSQGWPSVGFGEPARWGGQG